MFQDNPLLAQLKQQLHAQTPRVEGIVKGTDKNFGFLEVEGNKSYFIPPPSMKNVMPGDRIIATLQIRDSRDIAEPESLVEPFLNRFIGQIQIKENDKRLYILPDYPNFHRPILCRKAEDKNFTCQAGDWVVAELKQHPLKNNTSNFQAELTEFICHEDDPFTFRWVALSRYQLEKNAPAMPDSALEIEQDDERQDLTHFPFMTIDSTSTKDMDDALYVEKNDVGEWVLYIAIADPSYYIAKDSALDKIAAQRAFTTYLPGFDVPMLPREMADNLCSLWPNERRPAVVCQVTLAADGSISDQVNFFTAWIESKAKLDYNTVSDWLEGKTTDHPQLDESIWRQLNWMQQLADLRLTERQKHNLVFKDKPDYRFIFDDQGNVLNIQMEPRRIANRIVEEAMIIGNLCAANILAERLGFGIFNTHQGFDQQKIDSLINLLSSYDIHTTTEELSTLPGFIQLRQYINQHDLTYLDYRIRRFLAYADMTIHPQPHYGLAFEHYATWTSPIRKYGDLINHRLLKSLIRHQESSPPDEQLLSVFKERRRLIRLTEKEVSDKLYARYFYNRLEAAETFEAQLIDVNRSGIRARLTANGAVVFIPNTLIHPVREEITSNQEAGTVQIKNGNSYQLGDNLSVVITEVRLDNSNIIARLSKDKD